MSRHPIGRCRGPHGAGRSTGLALSMTAGVVLAAGGCQQQPCAPGIDANGALYQVDVLGAYVPPGNGEMDLSTSYASAPSCDGFDGLGAGSSLVIRTDGAVPTAGSAYGCSAATAALLSGPPGWQVTPASGDPPLDPSREFRELQAWAPVVVAGCSGIMILELGGESGTPSVLYRFFLASDGGACATCADNFSAQVSAQ